LPNAGLCDREMNTSLDAVVHGAQNPSMSDMRGPICAPIADKIPHRKETPLCAAR